MQRFKLNDAVFVLPKFAYLFLGDTGVVSGVKLDPLRPMFNEYTVEFPNGTAGSAFEFQLIEDMPTCKTLIASVSFDSKRYLPEVSSRGQLSSRHIVLETYEFDVDMKVDMPESRPAITGQVLERRTNAFVKDLEVRLMIEGMLLTETKSDSTGLFRFTDITAGQFNLLVVIPQHLSRILGAFSI